MSGKDEFIEIFRENIHREGSDALLDYLERTGRKLAVASSSTRALKSIQLNSRL